MLKLKTWLEVAEKKKFKHYQYYKKKTEKNEVRRDLHETFMS